MAEPRARRRRTPARPVEAAAAQPKLLNAALLASARRIEVKNPDDLTWLKKQRQEWQTRAWQYNDTLGEVNFAHRYLANMLSRLRLFPAWKADPNADPIPMDPDEPPEGAPPEFTELAINARLELERLAGSTGSYGPILGPLAWNVGLVGEAFLVGLPDDESPTGESFDVLSIDELQVRDADRGDVYIKSFPNDTEGQALDPNTFFLRIWRRHPRWRNLADAPMSALLDVCQELQLLTATVLASAQSRLPAGILALPDEMMFESPLEEPDGGDGQARQDPFMADLETALTQPLLDPGAPSTLVPLLLRAPAEFISAIRHVTLSRELDAQQLEERNELRTRLATGLDLPAEIILGMEDANHWTAWQIDEQTYKAHLDPLATLITESLTKGFLHPALRAANLNPRNIVIGHDPSDLIGDENEFDQAAVMHEQRVVSHAYLRRKGGASEDDAPDEDELASWPTATTNTGPFGSPETVASPPGQQSDTTEGPPAAETAAARPRRNMDLNRLALRLASIDRGLRESIGARADLAVRRTLEIAGAQLRRALNRADKELAVSGRSVPVAEFAAHVGRERLVALQIEPDRLLDADLDDLERFYRTRTTAAYRQTITAIVREMSLDLSPSTIDSFEEDRDRNIEAGWIALAAGVRHAAETHLFTPHPAAPVKGEFDALSVVPAGVVRESLAIAGGAVKVEPDVLTGTPSGGIATGDATAEFMDLTFGITSGGGRWLYGDPSSRTRPFEPHEALDGVDFADWNDEVLLNLESWPDTDYFFPGDHDTCQCDYIPALEAGT